MGDGIEGGECQLLESASPGDWLITLYSWADAIPRKVSFLTPYRPERLLSARPEPGQGTPGAERQGEDVIRLFRQRPVQEVERDRDLRHLT